MESLTYRIGVWYIPLANGIYHRPIEAIGQRIIPLANGITHWAMGTIGEWYRTYVQAHRPTNRIELNSSEEKYLYHNNQFPLDRHTD